MGMWKKNPNHLNKYKGTATEQDYKHKPTPATPIQLDQWLQWEKKKKLYKLSYIFKL